MYDAKPRFPRPFRQKQIPSNHSGYRLEITYPEDRPAIQYGLPPLNEVYRMTFHLDKNFAIVGSHFYIENLNTPINYFWASWPIELPGQNQNYEVGTAPNIQRNPISVQIQLFRSDGTLDIKPKIIDLKKKQLPGGDIFDAVVLDLQMNGGDGSDPLDEPEFQTDPIVIQNDPLHLDTGGTWVLACPLVDEMDELVRDEFNEVDIVGSDKPDGISPNLTAMVERNLGANPAINDANTVRIAWRDLKVRVGSQFEGKKVTWTMSSLYTRPPVQGQGNPPPEYRGEWQHAINSLHRHGFSPSEGYTDSNGGNFAFSNTGMPTVGGGGSNDSVLIGAETEVDALGFTAIRVNVPPIGLNSVRITVSIEDVHDPGQIGVSPEFRLIDLIVPAIVVIDPGHGGHDIGAPTATGIPNEEDFALDYSLELHSELEPILKSRSKHHMSLLTRKVDVFRSLSSRPIYAKERGADIFVSVHFNSATSNARGVETWVDLYSRNFNADVQNKTQNNQNLPAITTDDDELAGSLQTLMFQAVQSYDFTSPNDLWWTPDFGPGVKL